MRTVYVIANRGGNEQLLMGSEAALFVLTELGGFWRKLSTVARILPLRVRDAAYDGIARHRYQIFGRHKSCPLPAPEVRSRFLDLP